MISEPGFLIYQSLPQQDRIPLRGGGGLEALYLKFGVAKNLKMSTLWSWMFNCLDDHDMTDREASLPDPAKCMLVDMGDFKAKHLDFGHHLHPEQKQEHKQN